MPSNQIKVTMKGEDRDLQRKFDRQKDKIKTLEKALKQAGSAGATAGQKIGAGLDRSGAAGEKTRRRWMRSAKDKPQKSKTASIVRPQWKSPPPSSPNSVSNRALKTRAAAKMRTVLSKSSRP